MRFTLFCLFLAATLADTAEVSASPASAGRLRRWAAGVTNLAHPAEVRAARTLAGSMSQVTSGDQVLVQTAEKLASRITTLSLGHLMEGMHDTGSQALAASAYMKANAKTLTPAEALEVVGSLQTFYPKVLYDLAENIRTSSINVGNIAMARAIVYDNHPNQDVRQARSLLSNARTLLDQKTSALKAQTDTEHDLLLRRYLDARVLAGAAPLSASEWMTLAKGARLAATRRDFEGGALRAAAR